MRSYLFLTDSIKNHVKREPPVILVGLPRSGSSFLSDILSQIDDWYVFDDLYLYREAKAIGADKGCLSEAQLDRLLYFLGWQIRARIQFGTFSVPNMSMEDVDAMDEALRTLYKNERVTWSELLEEWMLRLAHNQGCRRWGYKAPQDFLHTDILNSAFPGLKYIFIQRDPRAMMRSLKYVHDNDGNPKQYHPLVYSLYWKSCAQKMAVMREQGDEFLLVRFEDLISRTADVAEDIAAFLDSPMSKELEIKQNNSSFHNKKKQELTSTEVWLIEKVAGEYLQAGGYEKSSNAPEVMGILEVIRVSFVFTSYQIGRVFKKKSALVSIKSMIGSLGRSKV